MPFKIVLSSACTADKSNQKIVGKFSTKIEYKGVEHEIEIFIIPSLKQVPWYFSIPKQPY